MGDFLSENIALCPVYTKWAYGVLYLSLLLSGALWAYSIAIHCIRSQQQGLEIPRLGEENGRVFKLFLEV